MGLVLQWILKNGGLHCIEQINFQKAKSLYDTIDASNGFYV